MLFGATETMNAAAEHISSIGFVKDCFGNVFCKEHPKSMFALDDALLPDFKLGDFITFTARYAPKYDVYMISDAEVDIYSVPPEIAVVGDLRLEGAVTYAYEIFLKMNIDHRRFVHDHLGVIGDCAARHVAKMTVNSMRKLWIAFVEPDLYPPHGRLRVLAPREENQLIHMNPLDSAYRSLRKHERKTLQKDNESITMTEVEVADYIEKVPRIVITSEQFGKGLPKLKMTAGDGAMAEKPSVAMAGEKSEPTEKEDIESEPTKKGDVESKPTEKGDVESKSDDDDEPVNTIRNETAESPTVVNEELIADGQAHRPTATTIKEETMDENDDEMDDDKFVRFVASALKQLQRTTPKLAATMKSEVCKMIAAFRVKSSLISSE